jgi:uncharacterized protein YktB (UPF0637 family)
VLLAKHRNRRRQLNSPARLWGYLQDAAVGYGYRPTFQMRGQGMDSWLQVDTEAVETDDDLRAWVRSLLPK